MADVCCCFLDEDGEKSIHSFFYVDLLASVEKFLDEFEDIFDKQGFSRA